MFKTKGRHMTLKWFTNVLSSAHSTAHFLLIQSMA